MKAIFDRPMSPWLAWIVTFVLLSSGGIYCAAYGLLAHQPDGFDTGLNWAIVGLVPWLIAFEVGKRVNCDPTRSWKTSWWLISGVLAVTGIVSVSLQDWLWADWSFSAREAALAGLRRTPSALLISILLFLFPLLQQRSESGAEASFESGDLPLLPRQIDWIRASGNYLEIMTGRRLVLHRMTMATAEQLLRQHNFVRVHRSALINADRVEKHDRGKIADEVLLHDGTRLKVGGSYRSEVGRRLGAAISHRR